jgi:hypothetical protein
MDVAQFEEKQYETGLLFELAGTSPDFFPSGQALEAALGYDFALSPGDSRIWGLLDAGLPPGIVLTPSLWPSGRRPDANRLPPNVVSLIVQAKRPQYLDHWRAGQHHHWRGPYFRFHLDQSQQGTLAHLERRVARAALVRYACAAFVEYSALIRHQLRRTLAQNSTFVAPGALVGHRLWSYAGPGTTGYANPEGQVAEADSLESLLATARATAARQSLAEHFHSLASALGESEQGEAWTSLLADELRLDEPRADVLLAWARVASTVARAGASWLILGFSEPAESATGISEPRTG